MADLVRPVTVDTTILASTTAVAAEPAWSNATTYAIGAPVNRDLNGQGRAWKSLVNANLGHDPALDAGTNWQDQGPTLPWLMFGDSATRQTTSADPLIVQLQLPTTERVNTMWFGNLSGVSLRATQTDAIDGVVFDQVFDLTSPGGITDPYHYSFDPIERRSELLITGLLPYSGSLLTIIISDTPIVIPPGAGGVLDFSMPADSGLLAAI